MNKTKRFVIGLGGIVAITIPMTTCISFKSNQETQKISTYDKFISSRCFEENTEQVPVNQVESLKNHIRPILETLDRDLQLRISSETRQTIKRVAISAIKNIGKGVMIGAGTQLFHFLTGLL